MNTLHVDRSGRGPVLLLVHGWAMHGGIFAGLAEALAARFRILRVDLPGHGGSRSSSVPLALDAVADDLVEVLDAAAADAEHRDDGPALVVGWSLGGLFAMAFAARHPARVRGLGMIAASPRFVQASDWPAGMDSQVFERFAEELVRDDHGTLDRFLMLQAQGSAQPRDELRFLRAMLFERGQPAAHALHEGLGLLQSSDLRAELPKLAMPSLWLGGRRDHLVSTPALQAAASLAPHATLRVFENAGHAPFLSQPQAVADALTIFAAGCPR